jgi:hypothetical protein
MKDLLVLCADQDAEFALRSLITRIPYAESLSPISFDTIRHPQRDSGVANNAVEFVRPYIQDYRFLLVIFDHEGCGQECKGRSMLETDMERSFNVNGWRDRNACVLFEPELESWLWVNSVHLHNITDWDHEHDIYTWIRNKGFEFHPDFNKPIRPKEAFEAALRNKCIPRSSSLYSKLVQNAGYSQCVDPSFDKFLRTIKSWFTIAPQGF